MNKDDCQRNIFFYRLYAAFNEPLFWGPIVIASLQHLAHMPLPSIYYMESTVLCLVILLDIPFGALADVIGRKTTIILGRIFLFGSAFYFAIMQRPLDAWTGNVLWAIGVTLQSGADSALLYDTLAADGGAEEYQRIIGGAIGNRLFLTAFCSLATGLLAGVDLRLPLYVGLPFLLIPLGAALFFNEPARVRTYSARKQWHKVRDGGRFVSRSVAVLWILGFAALVNTTGKLWFFTYNPYFALVSISVAQYGVIFFMLNMVAWFFSRNAYKFKRIGEKKIIGGMIACVGAPIIAMGAVPIKPFAYLCIVQNIVRGFMNPFVSDYLNRHVTTEIRATVNSFQSSTSNLVAIGGLAVFGLSLSGFGLLHSLVILGAAFVGLGGLSYWFYVRKIA